MESKTSPNQKRKAVPDLPPLHPVRRYSIDLASDYLLQCRAKTYTDISAGRLEAFKDGKRTYITGRSLIARMLPETCKD